MVETVMAVVQRPGIQPPALEDNIDRSNLIVKMRAILWSAGTARVGLQRPVGPRSAPDRYLATDNTAYVFQSFGRNKARATIATHDCIAHHSIKHSCAARAQIWI